MVIGKPVPDVFSPEFTRGGDAAIHVGILSVGKTIIVDVRICNIGDAIGIEIPAPAMGAGAAAGGVSAAVIMASAVVAAAVQVGRRGGIEGCQRHEQGQGKGGAALVRAVQDSFFHMVCVFLGF